MTCPQLLDQLRRDRVVLGKGPGRRRRASSRMNGSCAPCGRSGGQAPSRRHRAQAWHHDDGLLPPEALVRRRRRANRRGAPAQGARDREREAQEAPRLATARRQGLEGDQRKRWSARLSVEKRLATRWLEGAAGARRARSSARPTRGWRTRHASRFAGGHCASGCVGSLISPALRLPAGVGALAA